MQPRRVTGVGRRTRRDTGKRSTPRIDLIIGGILIPVILAYFGVAAQRNLWPFGEDSSTPTIVIDEPKHGDTVGYPTPLTGRIVGRGVARSESIWAAQRGGNGLHYPLSSPCTVQPDKVFHCARIALGRPDQRKVQQTVCVFLVSDVTQFRDYAARNDPRNNHPGMELNTRPIIAQKCHTVQVTA